MDKFLIRNESLDEFSLSQQTLLSPQILAPSSSIPEDLEEFRLPSKKRKLIDRWITSSNEKIKRTKNNYSGSSSFFNDDDINNIYDSLSDIQIQTYTNFFRNQFDLLYLDLEPFLTIPHQKGRKSNFTMKDSLFFYILRLKTGATYEMIAVDFDIKNPSTLFRLCDKLELLLHKAVLKLFFLPYTKLEQEKREIKFQNFPQVMLIVDSTLQPCQKPALPFEDGKIFYSGKHQCYGLKKETAHLPDGRIAFTFPHSPGSKHDISLFREHLDDYIVILF